MLYYISGMWDDASTHAGLRVGQRHFVRATRPNPPAISCVNKVVISTIETPKISQHL